MKRFSTTLLLGMLLATAWQSIAQTSPMLQIQTIEITNGGPLKFGFRDSGSGASSYVAEFSPVLGPAASWKTDSTAVITLRGDGEYEVTVADPAGPDGFYRIVGQGTTTGEVVMNFATTAFRITEGGAVSPAIQLSAPFTGVIRYVIGGTAKSGDFEQLSGEIEVNNSTSAAIPLSLTDNEVIGQLKSVTLRLEPTAGLVLGARSQTTVHIDENDARWEGSFISGQSTLPFSLELFQKGETTHGFLVGDSFSFFPDQPMPAIVSMTEQTFSASIDEIPMPAEASLLNLPSLLQLALHAAQGEAEEEVGENFVQGRATLIVAFPSHTYLNSTNQGTFLLQRPPVAPSTEEVELVHVP